MCVCVYIYINICSHCKLAYGTIIWRGLFWKKPVPCSSVWRYLSPCPWRHGFGSADSNLNCVLAITDVQNLNQTLKTMLALTHAAFLLMFNHEASVWGSFSAHCWTIETGLSQCHRISARLVLRKSFSQSSARRCVIFFSSQICVSNTSCNQMSGSEFTLFLPFTMSD